MIFRYPGGKQRLLPVIMAALDPMLCEASEFHDVFVGGGSVLIGVANKYPGMKLFANDLDSRMAAFWNLVAKGSDADCKKFCELLQIPVTIARFNALRLQPSDDPIDSAYHAVFFNRTTFSGIATAGPIGGQGQRSEWAVNCRFNADRLISEFNKLRKLFRDRLVVSCRDAIDYLAQATGIVYLDPPYYVQGKNLYPKFMQPAQHVALASALRLRNRWVLSYDNCQAIRELYEFASIQHIDARYSINGRCNIESEKSVWTNSKECLITP